MENKQIKILAIDDNRDNLISIKAIISEVIPQSVVYVEDSGQRGIESARKNEPDVILLDIVMPGIDGYEVCKILKADQQLSEIPIIFLTALKGDKQSRITALEAGGEAFLAKPVESTELKAQILAMLKIKEAAANKRDQQLQLEELVQKRTEELKNANIAALNLLEALHAENEIRKQSETALRESEERFRVAQEFSPDGFTIFHPVRNENSEIVDFTWVYENQTIARINGTDPEDVIGKRLLSIFPTHKGSSIFEAYIYVAKSKTPLIIEEVYVGEILLVPTWLRLVVVPMNSDIAILAQDITERKKAEEKLKLLNRAVETSSVSVVIADAEGIIHYVNPYFSELTGYSADDVFGKRLRILNPGKLSESDSEALNRAILSGNDWIGEYQNKKKNGELYWEKAVVSTIMSSTGELSHIVSINDDMTERKKLFEELVVAKEKAEESDRLKSAFLANMSHEIRTPMNGILGFTELLKEPELSGEQQNKYIQIIQASGARMLNIINDIVSISKIESGVIDIRLIETNINSQVQFVYDILKLDADSKNLTLSFSCGLPEKEAVIYTDSEKFYGILSNLVKNAIKYTDSGTIEFGYTIKGNEFEFFVKDTGVGIPKEKQEAIFERFIQADIADKMARQGAGLGLAISRAYVGMLGGKIWVESEERKGSTFYFTLPRNTAPVSAAIDLPTD